VDTSCDEAYFDRFLPACAGSFVDLLAGGSKMRLHLHLHLLDPSERLVARARELGTRHPALKLSLSFDHASASMVRTGVSKGIYYTCSRFLWLPTLVESFRRPIVLLDVDSVLETTLDLVIAALDGHDVGLYFRDFPIVPWMDYVANVVAVNPHPSAISYFRLVGAFIRRAFRNGRDRWHLDQAALYCVHRMLERFGGTVDLVDLDAEARSGI
jgi:hypothetical protein